MMCVKTVQSVAGVRCRPPQLEIDDLAGFVGLQVQIVAPQVKLGPACFDGMLGRTGHGRAAGHGEDTRVGFAGSISEDGGLLCGGEQFHQQAGAAKVLMLDDDVVGLLTRERRPG